MLNLFDDDGRVVANAAFFELSFFISWGRDEQRRATALMTC